MHKFKSFDVKADGENGSFVGYASTFDREPDSYGDVIKAGAFSDTLKAWKESGKPIPIFYDHRMDDPDMLVGMLTDAGEDDRGLRVEGQFFDTPKAQTVRARVNDGTLNKMSFAYDVLEDGTVTLDDGTKAHELRKLDLYEVSVVPVPANQHATIESSKAAEPGTKEGRRNSKADADLLGELGGMLQDALDIVNQLTDGEQDETDDQTDDQSEEDPDGQTGSSEGDDAKALADLGRKYARFIH